MNLFSGLKGEGMNKVQSDLEKFAEELKQLCEKYDVMIWSDWFGSIKVSSKDNVRPFLDLE
jgi:hypothetical protein